MNHFGEKIKFKQINQENIPLIASAEYKGRDL